MSINFWFPDDQAVKVTNPKTGIVNWNINCKTLLIASCTVASVYSTVSSPRLSYFSGLVPLEAS